MAETVQGLSALLKAMEQLPAELQQELIVEALEKGAEPIRAKAALLAPDDPGTAGSRIRDNMMIAVSEPAKAGAVAKIGPSSKGWMGRFAELGTKHQRATPFLQPAFDQEKDNAVKIIGETLAEGIEAFMKQ